MIYIKWGREKEAGYPPARGWEPHDQAVISAGADHPFRSVFRLPSCQTQPLTHEVNLVFIPCQQDGKCVPMERPM